MVFFMIVYSMTVGNLLFPLLPAGFVVGVGGGNVRWRYIPNALKMVAELYHSTANSTKIAGSISHDPLGCGRLS